MRTFVNSCQVSFNHHFFARLFLFLFFYLLATSISERPWQIMEGRQLTDIQHNDDKKGTRDKLHIGKALLKDVETATRAYRR